MTFQLDSEQYHKDRNDILDREFDMLYVINNVVYWYPEIKDRLSDAEQAMFSPVFDRALKILSQK